MKPDPLLMIPGPTPVPEPVLEVLARPPIGHRSTEFKGVLKEVYSGLRWIFQTKRPVFLYTASGTGAMEAALVNTVNPGEHILVLSCGVFSQRWAEIGKELGLTVHVQEVPHGHPNTPDELERYLKNHQGEPFKAVCMIHSETSTGVLNPVKELAAVVKANSNALVIVDTVTSLVAAPFEMDNWGIDIAVSGSQKGFMIPPGLAFLAASQAAMEAHKQCHQPGYYFNFSKAEKSVEPGQTPYTPAVSLGRGLHLALQMLQAEGLENIHKRHKLNQCMTREAMKAMGLPVFVEDDAFASPAVTSVLPPADIAVADIRAELTKGFAITIANGQKDLEGKIFRIGHLGAIFPRDVLTVAASLEAVCHKLGYNKTPVGTAVAAAQEVWVRHG